MTAHNLISYFYRKMFGKKNRLESQTLLSEAQKAEGSEGS